MCGICCFYGKHIRQYNVIMNQWIEISHTQKKKEWEGENGFIHVHVVGQQIQTQVMNIFLRSW